MPASIPGRSSGRPGGEKYHAASCRRLEPGGFSQLQTYVPHKKVRGAKRPVGHCLLSPQPLCGSGSWLLFQGFLEVSAKERCLSNPSGLVLHCRHSEHCLCKCSSPAWKRSLSNWVTVAETHHFLCILVRALTKAVKPKLLSAGGAAITLLRRCLCMGFSSPLAPFNLLFGKTTQCSSPLCVSISSYLNLLQRLLKATGGPGKRPASACALAAWRRCCRYSTKRRSTSSHAPQPLRGARPRVRRATRGGVGQGSSAPLLHPSPVAVWLGSSQCHHRRGKASPHSWGA